MLLWDGIAGITGISWLRGGPRKSLIAWSGPPWDNPKMRSGRYGPVVMAALFCPAGGEPGRWRL
jgi:hypothetical protein